MPRRARDNYKTWLANAIEHNRYSLRYLRRLFFVFTKDHPEHAHMIRLIWQMKAQEQKAMLDLWRHSWGPSFSRWNRWVSVKATQQKQIRGRSRG